MRRFNNLYDASCLLLLSAISACHHARPTTPCTSTQTLTLSIVADSSVTITWLPACTVGHVDVSSPERVGTKWLWSVRGADNAIASGVTYGVKPPHSTSGQAAPLSAGQQYRVWVGVILGGDQIVWLADTTFTR
jgi:hypothetical protein